MKAYYGSRISPNQTETNGGYLICHNVPIARTGKYDYLGSEIGADTNDMVSVWRTPEEVFSPSAMSSFNGMPVTNDHPPIGLDASNARDFQMGTVTNVRRGSGSNADLLLADLIIHDERLINEIRNGKREVSAGYECDYIPNEDGTFAQVRIIGNHVAVVDQGRAGHRVSIQDAKGVNKIRTRDESDKELDKQAEEAARKYGIAVKKDGHRTPPEGYPKDREEYGDPVNYKYPLNDREHVQAAVEYFDKKKDHREGDYSDEEWKKIGERVTKAANRVLHKGYEYKDGTIIDNKQTHDSKGGTRMKIKIPSRTPNSVRKAFQAMGFKQFAMDAEPDEIMDAWDAMSDEEREEAERAAKEDGEKGATTKDDGAAAEEIDDLKKELANLKEMYNELVKSKAKDEKSAEETLDEELKKLDDDPETEEESKTVDPEEMTEDEPGPVSPESDRPHSGITGDSAAKRAALMAIKPVLASIPDEKTRKQVVDTAIASFKGRSGNNAYGNMMRDTKTRTQARQRQQAQQEEQDFSALGEEIRNKHNPHYKNRQQA